MSRATPQLRDLARRLMAHEARENKFSVVKTPTTVQVCEKLRPQLVTLVGTAGFHALLSRALAVACHESPALRVVHVNSDGTLAGIDELAARTGADEMVEAKVVLIAQLLGLLVAFIGEGLTVRIVHQVWPTMPVKDFDRGRG